jgi:hypothetical protein
MGIYWTMKYPNKKDEDLLTGVGVICLNRLMSRFIRLLGIMHKYKEQGIPTDFPFSIRPNELKSK